MPLARAEMNRRRFLATLSAAAFSRVRRGGAWNDAAVFCRSALRLRYEPERDSDHIGFRVVLVEG
jgi:formylglycine-generating enzyme required for sulfatase activity